ncbi:MAG TPA: acyl carrier protein [Actinomycetota bacterium]|nr:acyl carrier protein [Actinomycetota bacterium]
MRTRSKIEKFVGRELLEGASVDGDPLAMGLLDSLAVEQLVVFLEKEFNVTFTDDELVEENFESINAVVNLVEAKRRGQTVSR